MRYWLNIDKPPKKCVLHIEGCTYEVEKEATPMKGIGEIKKDGGWLSFSSHQEISAYFKHKWASLGYELSERCGCLDIEKFAFSLILVLTSILNWGKPFCSFL